MGTPDASSEAAGMDMGLATPDLTGVGDASPVASPAAAEECHADIRDFAFSPAVIEIEAGTTVVWRSHDTAPHTVTADDGTFDSDDLGQGDTFRYTFDQPGEYTSFCEIHPNMRGTVIVN